MFLKDRFPAYITYDRFEANQARLAANRSRAESPGAVRDGGGLLAGVVWCGRCGGRMYVRYGRADRRPSYICSTLRSDYALPLCQAVTAAEVEAWVAEQVLEVLQPAALEASLGAAAEVEQRRRDGLRHWEQRLERARYEADRAARQYQACEPENRLVARTLERRWEEALRRSSGWRRTSTASSGRSHDSWAPPSASGSVGWPGKCRRCGGPRRRRRRTGGRWSGC